MATKSEANILADNYETVRKLTRWYISLLKDKDMHHQFEIEGKKLNSAYWLVAHLVWAENGLLLSALGGEKIELPWSKQFMFGSSNEYQIENVPPIKEILNQWKEVHTAAMEHVRAMPDEMLEKESLSKMGFEGDNSNRMMIQHAIRHEAMHTGHLSWLCKLHGISTI